MTTGHKIILNFSRAFISIFAIIDIIGVVWYFESLSSAMFFVHLILIASELSVGIESSDFVKYQAHKYYSYIYIIGILTSLFFVYDSTTQYYGTDWFIFSIRFILSICFAYLYFNIKKAKNEL